MIYIPETNPFFANSLAIIPLQLFGYYVAVGKGCDVDKPRNLAKSVTSGWVDTAATSVPSSIREIVPCFNSPAA